MAEFRQMAYVEEFLLGQARMVVYRLERVSADSIWAHRSSGLRGGLLRWIDQMETGREISTQQKEAGLEQLETLIAVGFEMLEKAAREKIER